MKFIYSKHWLKKRKYRPDVHDYDIEYCILNSEKLKDRRNKGVWNSITKIPPSGRKLKVAYKTFGKTIKILTAYWLE